MDVPLRFGVELRRFRQEAHMTLREMAQKVNYSKGHLCKVERGDKKPSVALARRCDVLFRTDGFFYELLRETSPPSAERDRARREAIAVGAGSLLAATAVGRGGGVRIGIDQSDSPLISVLQDQLRQVRKVGQASAPGALLTPLRNQTGAIVVLAAQSLGTARTGLLVTAARFAEYAGWMAQEAGDVPGALHWTTQAVELAKAGGDRHLADYAKVRRALVTLYEGDAEQTIALARQAQSGALPPRIRGLAVQREAQGHALAGDGKACLNGLDRARAFLAQGENAADTLVLGPTHVTDPVSLATGWCLYDLGDHRKAAEVLDRECLRIPPHALRNRVRYGIRRALAHAASGEVERSCEVAEELLGFTALVPSATVRADVRRLDRELARFRSLPVVRDLRPALVNAMTVS
ncbi:MAG TPA: helix-turn-helix transcriptional regulator [Streptomyces sp.]